MKNDIVLFSVVHEDSGSYIDDFFESLNNQSFSNFDIFLINDNFLDLFFKNFMIHKSTPEF